MNTTECDLISVARLKRDRKGVLDRTDSKTVLIWGQGGTTRTQDTGRKGTTK